MNIHSTQNPQRVFDGLFRSTKNSSMNTLIILLLLMLSASRYYDAAKLE